MVRLRKQARHCNFGTSLNDNLRDQLIEKLTDFQLKRKLLEHRNIALEEALYKARAWEAAGRLATNITVNLVVIEGDSVNAIRMRQGKRDDKPRKCYNCGREGHLAIDRSCPAKGKKCTKCGRYKRLSFGVKSAPEKYQQIISQVVSDIGGFQNIADDLIVHGKNNEEHDRHLHKVLQRLGERNLTLNPQKCQFRMEKVVFMGLLVSRYCIGPTEEKVRALLESSRPTTPTEELKQQLAKAPVLAYFDKEAHTRVIADASPVGLGAVLVQEKNGVGRAICYASRSLSSVERRYSQTEKEALGLVWACERFNQYLYGLQTFDLVTDHEALKVIYSRGSRPSARIERWVLLLQPYSYKEIESASAEDEELQAVRNFLVSGNWEEGPRSFLMVRNELTFIGQVILRGTRILIPKVLRLRVLELAHEGHQGIVKMKERLSSKVWWPGVDKAVELKCRECYGCQLVTKKTFTPPVKITRMPERPWHDLRLDLLGPMPTGEYLLVIVDYFSRWVEVDIIKSTASETIIKCLDKQFSRYGVPNTLRTDNGPNLVCTEMEEYLNEMGSEHRLTTPLWPRADGEVQRQNRSHLKTVRVAHAEKRDWRLELNKYLLAYHSTPHVTVGQSPAELLLGRKLSTKLPEVTDLEESEDPGYQQARDRDSEKKQVGADHADKRHQAAEKCTGKGDFVLLEKRKENKFSPHYEKEPCQVIARHGDQVQLKSPQGVQYMRNIQHAKHFVTPATEPKGLNPAEPADVLCEQGCGQGLTPSLEMGASGPC
ncbi:Transposon Ty3-G Gag-Pol polyprotein [Stylophora pistillata]|uniref:Transposon Ty3-G Gag-Pol polyprotein n=1 Tax=Stylophora pistillata TaxID=50429 RepID=A0A2B4RRE6_STYPI|nr:Transposon Ty3-G Gag-Pol polyprotein [Stylophora pistillata]